MLAEITLSAKERSELERPRSGSDDAPRTPLLTRSVVATVGGLSSDIGVGAASLGG